MSKLAGFYKIRLEDNFNKSINRNQISCWDFGYSIGDFPLVSFSSVGYMTQLTNAAEVKHESGIATKSEQARYNLLAPDGSLKYQDLSYEESQGHLWSESKTYLEKLNQEFEANKEEIEKELSDILIVENNSETSEPEPEFNSPFNENISKYAKNIGIKPEELAANKEFVELTPAQQQFALETLRRSSLAKAKVEGHESFIKEKASKKWWKVGFALNQNYHKERHKVEAVQNIESRGLEGYGETELAWLIEVIKTGPEVKINDAGEVIVDCLQESSFSEEQKELVAKYNEAAREYIETSDDKDNDLLQKKLGDIKNEIFRSAQGNDQSVEINNLLLKSKNNIELLKFLSADKETEQLLDKMAVTSLKGKDKARAMFGAHKDKLGYMAMGFTLRTGAKFALANSACLANAVSYGVGPMVAAIVGGFRGYNMGNKELIEKEELARLGVKDQSSTAKSMNLATGAKEGVSFGLAEKLQNLVNKLKAENRVEEIETITQELNLRIGYTEVKINSESVDYGSTEERNRNYFNLINTLAEAKSIIGERVSFNKFSGYWVGDKTLELTRGKTIDLKKLGLNKNENESDEAYQTRLSQNKKFVEYQAWANNEKQLEELSKISVRDRLASFLDYREEKQDKKEVNFLIKKIATGAVMGATFAAAGAFVAEQLGVANWLSEHNPIKAVGKGVEAIKHIINPDGASTKTNIVETVASGKTTSVADTSTVKVSSSAATEQVVAAKSVAPKVAKFVDEISNKGLGGKSDSVWRSTREIFEKNAEALGYKGDLDDESAINHWAETQTANTIHNSGEISDKIYEGNKVSLVKDGNHFKAVVEQAQGGKPAHLIHEIKTAGHSNRLTFDKLDSETKIQHIPDLIIDNPPHTNLLNQQIEQAVADKKFDISNRFHFKPEDLKSKGTGFVYNKGAGQVFFDHINDKIEMIFSDKNGSTIPDSFINEMRGKSSLDKFVSKGLDKTFKFWNNLSNDDRSLYQLLGGKMTKDELLNQIKTQFKISSNNIKITPDNKFAIQTGLNKQEYFDLSFKGVKNMLKAIAKLS